MKTIKKDELFQSLGDFLKLKGVELRDGAYAKRIRQGCDLLTPVKEKNIATDKQNADALLDGPSEGGFRA